MTNDEKLTLAREALEKIANTSVYAACYDVQQTASEALAAIAADTAPAAAGPSIDTMEFRTILPPATLGLIGQTYENVIAHINQRMAEYGAQRAEEVAAHQQRHIDQLKARSAGLDTMLDLTIKERDEALAQLAARPTVDLQKLQRYATITEMADHGKWLVAVLRPHSDGAVVMLSDVRRMLSQDKPADMSTASTRPLDVSKAGLEIDASQDKPAAPSGEWPACGTPGTGECSCAKFGNDPTNCETRKEWEAAQSAPAPTAIDALPPLPHAAFTTMDALFFTPDQMQAYARAAVAADRAGRTVGEAIIERKLKDAIRAAYDDGYNNGRTDGKGDGGVSRYLGQKVERERGNALLAEMAPHTRRSNCCRCSEARQENRFAEKADQGTGSKDRLHGENQMKKAILIASALSAQQKERDQ